MELWNRIRSEFSRERMEARQPLACLAHTTQTTKRSMADCVLRTRGSKRASARNTASTNYALCNNATRTRATLLPMLLAVATSRRNHSEGSGRASAGGVDMCNFTLTFQPPQPVRSAAQQNAAPPFGFRIITKITSCGQKYSWLCSPPTFSHTPSHDAFAPRPASARFIVKPKRLSGRLFAFRKHGEVETERRFPLRKRGRTIGIRFANNARKRDTSACFTRA